MENLKLQTGLDMVHVPFKGSSQTSAAIRAGDVQVGLDAIAPLKPHFDAGRLRPMASCRRKRTPLLPRSRGCRNPACRGSTS